MPTNTDKDLSKHPLDLNLLTDNDAEIYDKLTYASDFCLQIAETLRDKSYELSKEEQLKYGMLLEQVAILTEQAHMRIISDGAMIDILSDGGDVDSCGGAGDGNRANYYPDEEYNTIRLEQEETDYIIRQAYHKILNEK